MVLITDDWYHDGNWKVIANNLSSGLLAHNTLAPTGSQPAHISSHG